MTEAEMKWCILKMEEGIRSKGIYYLKKGFRIQHPQESEKAKNQILPWTQPPVIYPMIL